MKSFEKQIKTLESSLPRDEEDQERIDLEIQFVVKQRNDLMKNPARHMCKRRTIARLEGNAAARVKLETEPRLAELLNLSLTTADTGRHDNLPSSRPQSRRQSLSNSTSDTDLMGLFEPRPDQVASPVTSTFISSIVPVVATTTTSLPLLPTSHLSSSPIVMVPSLQTLDAGPLDQGPRQRRLSVSGQTIVTETQDTGPVDAPLEAPVRRKSFTTIPITGQLPSAPMFSFPAEATTPYTIYQPQTSSPQYQILQQQFYNGFGGGGFSPQPNQCLYVLQSPPGQVFTTAPSPAPMYFNTTSVQPQDLKS